MILLVFFREPEFVDGVKEIETVFPLFQDVLVNQHFLACCQFLWQAQDIHLVLFARNELQVECHKISDIVFDNQLWYHTTEEFLGILNATF